MYSAISLALQPCPSARADATTLFVSCLLICEAAGKFSGSERRLIEWPVFCTRFMLLWEWSCAQRHCMSGRHGLVRIIPHSLGSTAALVVGGQEVWVVFTLVAAPWLNAQGARTPPAQNPVA